MERLRDNQNDQDLDVAHAARLVASARQREITDEHADRVWRRVQRSEKATRSPLSALWMRPAFAAVALVGMAGLAFAGATVGRRLVTEWLAGDKAPQAEQTGAAHRGHGATVDTTAPVAAPTPAAPSPSDPVAPSMIPPVDPAASTPAPSAVAQPAAANQHPRAGRTTSLPDPAVTVNNALDKKDAEAESIKLAVNALRRDADVDRARLHLKYYITHFPNGLFYEEALAMAVEAASKDGARADAAELARTYLSSYPAGRYRATVTKLAGRSPSGGSR